MSQTAKQLKLGKNGICYLLSAGIIPAQPLLAKMHANKAAQTAQVKHKNSQTIVAAAAKHSKGRWTFGGKKWRRRCGRVAFVVAGKIGFSTQQIPHPGQHSVTGADF